MSNLTGKCRTRVIDLFFTGQKCVLQVQYKVPDGYPGGGWIYKWRDAKPEDITECRVDKTKL